MQSSFNFYSYFSCLLFAFALSACKSEHQEHEELEQLAVTSPEVMDTVFFKKYVRQIQSIQHIELRALEKGYVEQVYVDEGQLVRKGTLLFRILPVIYQAEMETAKAEMNFALVEYNNTKALADSNVVSANQLALAQAKLAKAKAQLSLAEANLRFT